MTFGNTSETGPLVTLRCFGLGRDWIVPLCYQKLRCLLNPNFSSNRWTFPGIDGRRLRASRRS